MDFLKKNKKYYFFFLLFVLLGGATTVFAQLGYTPLAPIDGVDVSGPVDLGSYLRQMFNLAVGLAIVLSIFMIVLGGIQYTTSEAFGDKSAATKRIWSAVIGLILISVSVLILETINPELLKVNLVGVEVPQFEEQVLEEPDLFEPHCFKWRPENPTLYGECSPGTTRDCLLSDGYVRNCESSSLAVCQRNILEKRLVPVYVENYFNKSRGCFPISEVSQSQYCFSWFNNETNDAETNCSFVYQDSCEEVRRTMYVLSSQELSSCYPEGDRYRAERIIDQQPQAFYYQSLAECEAEVASLKQRKSEISNVDPVCTLER